MRRGQFSNMILFGIPFALFYSVTSIDNLVVRCFYSLFIRWHLLKILHKSCDLSQPGSQEKTMLHSGQMGLLCVLLRIRLHCMLLPHQEHKLLPDLAGRQRKPHKHIQWLSLKLRVHSINWGLLLGPVWQAFQQDHRSLFHQTRGQLLRIRTPPYSFSLFDHLFLPDGPLADWVFRVADPRLHRFDFDFSESLQGNFGINLGLQVPFWKGVNLHIRIRVCDMGGEQDIYLRVFLHLRIRLRDIERIGSKVRDDGSYF